MSTPLLKAEGLGIQFGGLKAVDEFNFEIDKNQLFGLIGPNGAGKTTLFQTIFNNNNSSIEINENIKIGYLSQLQGQTLNYSSTIADEFFDIGFKTYDT